MKLLSAIALIYLALVAGRAEAQTPELGWLVYQIPSTDPQTHVVTPGIARRIAGAWARIGNASIIDITDEEGDTLPVHFFLKGTAAQFLAAVRKGQSYDVHRCAHPVGFPIGPSKEVGFGAEDTPYAAEFHCDLIDAIAPTDAKVLTAPTYVLNPKVLSVTIVLRESDNIP